MSEPPANTLVTIEAFNKLKTLVTALSSQLSAQQQAQPQVQPESQTQPLPQTQQPQQPVPALWLGPLTGNPAAGTSTTSLFTLFPEVEVATITSIIQHDLRCSDLYKLDPRYCNKAERKTLELNSTTLELSNDDSSLKKYKTLSSIVVPLTTYFSILMAHYQPMAKSALLGIQLFRYTAHLTKITSEYEWHAVVAYHMAFFTRRRREMIDGDYGGWGRIDLELRGEHLFPNRKIKASSPTSKKVMPMDRSTIPCRNFNTGKCIRAQGPWGHQHICSTCGKMDHGAHTHKNT